VAASAISELFERHGAAVFRRCRQMLGQEAAARDAVQEVFMRALNQQHRLNELTSPFGWLYAIATAHCLQQLRNERRRAGKLSLANDAPPQAPPPDEKLRFLALLEDFPEDVQQIAYLRHVDGLRLEEIAEVTGLSTKTISRKLERFVEGSRVALDAPRSPT
jgi:RNA polymerase sigma-70 factor (ECF subfamily)